MKRVFSFLLLFQLCFACIVSASPLKPEELFPEQVYFPPKLNPSGDRLLVYTENSESGRLTIYNTKTFDILGVVQMGKDNFADELDWVNDDRLVYQLRQRFIGEQIKRYTGEIFAVNYDGSRADILFGYRAGLEGDSGLSKVKRAKKSVKALGWIEHMLPDDEKHILIKAEPFSRDRSRNDTLYRLNVYTGKARRIAPTVPLDESSFFYDKEGNPILAVGINEDKSNAIVRLVDDEWEKFRDFPGGSRFKALAMHPNGQSFYALSNEQLTADKIGLYKIDLKTKESKLIYENERVDLSRGVLGSNKELIAVEMHNGYPSYVIIPGKSNDKKIFKQLAKNFQGNTISIESSTANGDKAIVRVTLDTMPDLYYLFDTKSGKSSLLFKRLDVSTKRLTYMNPIAYESFDGRKIDGYFTSKTPKKPTPTVVLVHGGPMARDYFSFDETVQFLASHGFAVLQVNFRGSSGYGSDHQRSGQHHWGDHIQQDILAGLDWAIEKGYTDKNNVCIMGGSFGAYSAMMSSIIKPDAFNCIVANAGVYNLELMFTKGDIKSAFYGKNELAKLIGKDEAQLKKFSPVNFASKINAPVFLAHGKKDVRTPFIHAEEMLDALEDANKDVTTYFKYGEFHGFESRENQIAYLEKVLEFLKKHLN